MHRLLVLYPPPNDPEHFRRYFASTHVPLAQKLPGLRRFQYSFDAQTMGGTSPYFGVAELDFDSAEALTAALGSTEGQAAADDVVNYATGGSVFLRYDLIDGK